jgi:hypothetical protein
MAFNPLRFVSAPTTPKSREERVAEAAYFIALKRGFLPGSEAADRAAAEKGLDDAYQSSGAFIGELAP